MKPVSPAVQSLLLNSESVPFAECFTFFTANMQPFYFTNLDIDVQIGTEYFYAKSIKVDGMQYRCSVGLAADSQQLKCLASPDDKINSVPFLQALRAGVFDGGYVQRQRAIFDPATLPPAPGTAPLAIGSIQLFYGKISHIPSIGRTSATLSVMALPILLDLEMPRNAFQPSCSRTLYDAGCGLDKTLFTSTGLVGAGSTLNSIAWAGAGPAFVQGTLTLTSGVDIYDSVMVSGYDAGVLYLYRPLRFMPTVGDSFEVAQGCDHTAATCAGKFLNQRNFRGFPFIPPAEQAY